MSPTDLARKTVVITFGATGLGSALVRQMEDAGAQVVVAGGGEAEDADWVSRARWERGNRYKPFDARVPEQSEALVDEVLREFGALDVWINGLPPPNEKGAPETGKRQGSEASLGFALTGAFNCCQAAGRHMLSTGRGVVVNLSLVIGSRPIQGFVVESVISGGLIALTQALGVEWAPRGVRVVGVAAGPLEGGPNIFGDVSRRTPLRRLGTANEVAEAVMYLASDDASFITAETLAVDGGWCSFQMF
jgi:NAD(P)-dependent dehydrogenase (short-subunit alcohol dehydrogenase family)